MIDKSLAVGIAVLFIASTVTPAVISYDEPKENDEFLENLAFVCYDEYGGNAKYEYYKEQMLDDYSDDEVEIVEPVEKKVNNGLPLPFTTGPMDSAWPIYCHDVHHTGRSPYSTAQNPMVEMWNVRFHGCLTSMAITMSDDGTIYVPESDLLAFYPNGTLKWEFPVESGWFDKMCPAINQDGTIYVGSYSAGTDSAGTKYFYAINPNGTLKWKVSNGVMHATPVIDENGTIYYTDTWIRVFDTYTYLKARYPNGTLKWESFISSARIYSTPAIGEDGTLYFGSHDDNFYAFNPNGTLKWKYNTGNWIHCSPTIGDDGIIYVSSNNDYLYAFYPNGTVKWKLKPGTQGGAWGAPVLDDDGTLYFGAWNKKFYAINPNGTLKWSFDCPGRIWASSATLSSNGLIYFGTTSWDEGTGRFFVLNRNGEEIWSGNYGDIQCPPIIDENGNVYVATHHDMGTYFYWNLRAFGRGELIADAGGPYNALINEDIQFSSTIFGGIPPYEYLWDFGDGDTSVEEKPVYSYPVQGNYSITLTVTDSEDNVSVDTTIAYVRSPPSKPSIDGPSSGHFGEEYDYTFAAVDPESDDIWYYVDWGDDSNSGWLGPYTSGEAITLSHIWEEEDTYTLRCRAKDTLGGVSEWGTLEVSMPVTQHSYSFPLLQRLLERFPLLYQLFMRVLEVNPFDT